MERLLARNAWQAKWVLTGFFGGSFFMQGFWYKYQLINNDVFGEDGNGGRMLKIITDLTDEEMARLKYVRRLYWHWGGSRRAMDGKDTITNQELADRGIAQEEKYVEYTKRPPHDKYL